MPSVYDYRHVELDKIGKGKRVLQAPGGTSSNIFGNTNGVGVNGNANGNGNGNGVTITEADFNCVDGGSLSLPTTPINGSNGSTNGHYGFDSDSSTPSSASSSRRGSRQEDTKNRLFGQELESPRRRVVDRMKSNIFTEQEGGLVRSASVKKYDFVVRRNPITGEVYDEQNGRTNGHNGNGSIHGKSNGVSNSGSASLPSTPVRVRQPPGGKSSGIF